MSNVKVKNHNIVQFSNVLQTKGVKNKILQDNIFFGIKQIPEVDSRESYIQILNIKHSYSPLAPQAWSCECLINKIHRSL